MKTCTKCQQSKELMEFHKDSTQPCGFASWCKHCKRSRQKVRYHGWTKLDPEYKTKRKAYVKKYYLERKGQILEACKKYRDGHQEQKRVRDKAWVQANRALVNAYSKKYRKANLSKRRALDAKRYADERKQTPSWADLEKIRQVYRSCPEGYHVDHIIPLRGKNVCGLHVDYNLQHLPADVNRRKSNKMMEQK